MERKIGEIFKYNGEWYQCLESNSCRCDNCDFGELGGCHKIACASGERSDSKEVHFKKLKKFGGPFSCNYYGDSRSIMMQEYNLFNLDDVTNEDKIPMYITDYKHKRIAIETKVNKEDMGEKDTKSYDTEHLAKSNLKPFNLEEAKSGKPVCTRDGRKVRIICFDYKGDANAYPILALISTNNLRGVPSEIIAKYTEDGRYAKYNNVENDEDLMMLPEKKKGWVNVYKDSVYDTKDEALIGRSESRGYIDTIKVEWEE